MNPVSQHAQALAAAIAADPRTQALRAAQEALKDSPEDGRLQQRYHEVRQQLAALEQTQRPIEPPLKREAAALGDQVRKSQVLQRLLRAHAEFSGMMEEISQTLSSAVDEVVGAEDGAQPPEA